MKTYQSASGVISDNPDIINASGVNLPDYFEQKGTNDKRKEKEKHLIMVGPVLIEI